MATDPAQLSNDSPLLKKIYSTISTAICGQPGEANPMAQFSGMHRFTNAGDGKGWQGAFPDTCVGISVNNAESVYMYHDLPRRVRTQVGRRTMDENTINETERAYLRLSSNHVDTEGGELFVDVTTQSVLNVGAEVNRAFRLAREQAGIQGEYQLAALTGMRGYDDSIYISDEDMIDAQGTSIADAATGDFMDKVNKLQTAGVGTVAGAEVVRPLSRLGTGSDLSNLRSYEAPTVDIETIPAYSTSTRLGWEMMLRAKTQLKKLGNEARGPYTFRPAKLGMVTADGGQRKQTKKGFPVWMTNHDNIEYLNLSQSWEEAQKNLSQLLGESVGLYTGEVGLYRGNVVYGFDKMPVMHANSGVKVSLTICLGQGALCVSYFNKQDRGDFGQMVSRNMQKWMETSLPVNMNFWRRPGSRNNEMMMAPRTQMGVIRPAFPARTNGPKIDYGVVGILTPVQG